MKRIIDAGWHPLVDGFAPDWASEWGQDGFGVYVAFTVGDVTQRLRWIPPGRFMMGSPEDEPGRTASEGPRHEVTIMEGFWLFDTPCTQALWQEVMGDKPSRFGTPQRPVETVGFEDVALFLREVNARVPGLKLQLPSEAWWEYACRAGTQTATYAGSMTILDRFNAPILDPIAWYGGNSGKDFDLPDGEDSGRWAAKQYNHSKAGTRVVGQKSRNAWGLADMLGNVWEWCADTWHASYADAPSDGSAWTDQNIPALGVVRGGSWSGEARSARAAYRSSNAPSDRFGNLGFRCARVQAE